MLRQTHLRRSPLLFNSFRSRDGRLRPKNGGNAVPALSSCNQEWGNRGAMTRNSINDVPRYRCGPEHRGSAKLVSNARRRALGSRDAPEFKCGSLKLLLFVTALPHSAGLSFHTFVHTFVHLHLPLFLCLPLWSAFHVQHLHFN